MIRGWMICFLVTGGVLLVQLWPTTGIFLMILGGPYWSVILINLGFVLMAADAWQGRLPRAMLLFPALWFGGYEVAATVSHWQATRGNAAIAAANTGKTIAFDPGSQDLLLEPDRMDTNNGSSLSVDAMVENFTLDRAYFVADQRQGKTRSRWIEQRDCPDRSGAGVVDDVVWNRPNSTNPDRPGLMIFAQKLCLFSGEASPKKPVVRIRPQPQVGRYDDPQGSQDILIAAPDGKQIRLQSGFFRPLTWLPQPVIGCGLDSGAPAWRCFGGFVREPLYSPNADLTPNGPDDVVARALGLRKARLRDRYPNADWR